MFESKLYKKYFINTLLGILVVNLIITSLLYFFLIEKGKTNVYKDYIKTAQINFIKTDSYLNLRISHFKNIISTIEKSESFQKYILNNNKESLTEAFSLLLNANKTLFQIRYINKDGMEELRLDKDSNLKVTSNSNLQNKSDRYYFKQTMELSKDSFYVSNLDLNIEYDSIEIPYKPTIRVSKPIYKNDELLGMLIINYDATEIVNFIQNQEFFDVFVMDSNKNFFLHPDINKNYSTQLNTNYKVIDEIPNIEDLILENSFTDLESKFYTRKINLTNNPFYLIYSLKDEIYEKIFNSVKNDILFIFLLVFIITLPLVFYYLNRQSSQSVILEAILDNTPFPVFLKDSMDKIIMVNNYMVSLSGFENKEQIIGKKLDDILSKEDASKFQLSIDSVKSSLDKNRDESEIEILTKDGKKYFYDVKIVKILLFGFLKKIYILGIAVDITELKSLNLQLKDIIDTEIKNKMELERALLQQSKMAEMGNMIGNIIHQWKQPLSIISVLATGNKLKIENNIVNQDELKTAFDHIEEQVIFINETAQDFKEFFSPSKEKEYFLLNNSIERIRRVLSSRLNRLSIEFCNEVEKDISVFGYENDFGQVILSILNNAIDECEKSNKINLKISINSLTYNDFVVLRIDDDAGLIPQELLPNKIFEQYFTTKKEGTGLGLSICKKIIEENFNGKIKAYNHENLAVFEIVLPIKK